jgi:PAS domain S-box-containing protein
MTLMKPTGELRELIGPVLAHVETRDAERIEKILRRIEKHAELQERKLQRAILDRQAVHSLMNRTAGDLAKRYQTLFEQDSNPKVIIEKDGTISLANNSFCLLIHEMRGDVESKKNICDYLDGMICDPLSDDAAPRDDLSPPDLSSGQIHTAGGEFIDVLINKGSFPGSTRSIVTLINVSERMRLERELLETSGFLSGILQASPVGFHMTDTKGNYVYVNETWSAITGFAPDQVQGKYYSLILHPDDCDRIADEIEEIAKRRVSREIETRIIRPDGTVRWIFNHSVPVIDDGGQLTGWVGAVSDITERKKIETALKESEEKYRALTENTGDVLYSVDMDGNITYVSPQVSRYGYTQEEVISMPLSAFIHPLDISRVRKSLASQAQDRVHTISTFRIFSRNGNIHWLEGKSTLQTDASGKPLSFLGILRDVTDRKHAEDAIALANRKLNLMNNVTRHDILNTITGVYGFIDMANATSCEEERVQLLHDVKDLVGIIQRQINFTKQYQEVGIQEPQWQRVAAVIERVIPNFSRSGLEFAVELDRLEIYADPLLEKVFYNLIDNAIRYGDTLTTISARFDLSPAGLSLIIEDNGVGISSEEKEQIFERGIGKNTGLGLFMTREILGITGITITENGEPGKGAMFVLSVPRGAYRLADKD